MSRSIVYYPSFIFLILFGIAWPATAQQKFEPADYQKALVAGQIGEYAAAMEELGRRAQMAENWADASSAYEQAATAFLRLRQFQKAMSHASASVEVAVKSKSPSIEARAVLRLADVFGRIGQLQKEREWLETARAVIERMEAGMNKNDRESRLYMQLGQNCLRQGEIDQAITYFSESVALWDAGLNYLRSPGGAHTNNREGRIANAESQKAQSLDRLGRAYLQAGNLEKAVGLFARGLDVLQAANLKTDMEAGLLRNLGWAYLQQKDFERALERFVEALKLAEKQHQRPIIASSSSGIGELLLRAKRPSEAVPYFKKAVEITESTRSLFGSGDLRASFFDTNNRLGHYVGIINAYWEAQDTEQAFNYNERARSRAFLDILGTKVHLSARGLRQEEVLKASANTNVRTDATETGLPVDGPSVDRSGFEVHEDAFINEAIPEHKEQDSLMKVEPLKLKDIQALLEPGQTLIEYFVTPDKILFWVIERDRLNATVVVLEQKDLERKVDILRKSIAELKPLREYQDIARNLHDLLVRPALSYTKGKELIIVPHAVLHYLPFQALYSAEGRYLIEDYSISYLSSASLMQFTKAKRRAVGQRVLAVGNPAFEISKVALSMAELEAREIRRLYGQSTILARGEATEERVKALAGNHDVLHFATHAELNKDDPLASAVLLSKGEKEDGRLEVREIFGMDLKASLVVLSACETALGQLSSGDELVGLTRAFIYAGTPSVVASLWKVDDASTAHLMSSFYRNLKSKSKVESLRQAQLDMIRGKVNAQLLAQRGVGGVGRLGEAPGARSPNSVTIAHPYFWAPFILVGDGK